MSDARHRKPGAHRLMPARRRAAGLPGTLGVTFLGALAPGVGYLYARRRLLGWLVLASAVAALGFALWYVGRDLQAALTFATDPTRLKIAAALLGIGLLTWLVIVISTYRMVRPEQLTRKQSLAGGVFVALLCLAVVAPTYVGARYAMVQADLVGTVFEDNQTATAPQATKKDPWAGRSRVNVLLLGGDGGLGRDGIRTDSVILMSIATKTGKATLFSLPRNMMLAPFPEDSPLHAVYPSGFTGAGSDGNWMLNAIYKVVPEQHPGILGKSANEGADAIKLAVSATLGIEVDYYALVNLAGFKEVVDAMGGVTVNVNQRVAIHGDSSAGIPPVDYIEPGPDQHLDGYHALWFGRGRWGSDDYQRMERQRCLVNAMVEQAQPFTLLRRYQDLAREAKKIIRTDIPRHLLPAFVDLGLKMKDRKLKSVVFRRSAEFDPGNPDFTYVHETVAATLAKKDKKTSPSRPDTKADDECAYVPVAS